MSGCTSSSRPATSTAPKSDRQLARDQIALGNYLAAARSFESASAASDSEERDRLQLMAALAYQEGGDFQAADSIVAASTTADALAVKLANLAKARSLLTTGFHEDALAVARQVDPLNLTPFQKSVRARVIGTAALTAGQYDVAALHLSESHRYRLAGIDNSSLLAATWRALTRLPNAELAVHAGHRDPVISGWYRLAQRYRASGIDQSSLNAGLAAWQTQYATHPASAYLETLLAEIERARILPRQIGVVLPFDGDYAQASQAVRDGILTAWYGDRSAQRPTLKFYASGSDITLAYQQAVSEGAEAIIGPLTKDGVKALADLDTLSTPVLALNVPPGTSMAAAEQLYSFALLPEGEAKQVASFAYTQGHRRVLLIGPSNTWGNRLLEAYRNQWETLGGEVVAEQRFSKGDGEFSNAVKRALNIDFSAARAATLRADLSRAIEFEPRRRQDIDAVLIAARPQDGRQLLPQLRYYRAENIATFATSHVYAGVADPSLDHDLNGLVFGDMPWLFGLRDPNSFASAHQNWRDMPRGLQRLFAFGLDAYRVMPQLHQLKYQPLTRFDGVTGVLSADDTGVLHRQLVWLRFNNGIPGVIESGSQQR